MQKVLITGGSGHVGKRLQEKLEEKKFLVSILSTTKKPNEKHSTYFWNIENNEIDKRVIDDVDYIVHLAGANIGDARWTRKRKQLIIDSRVKSAQLIFNLIKESNKTIKGFISASAVGYYGAATSDKIFTETDDNAADFLGETCALWEQASNQFNKLRIRVVRLRTGVVLTKQGGALAKMITPIKLGIGSSIGSGKQYLPWIHIEDLCDLYIKAIEDVKMNGVYNAVAPEHITNKEFNKCLANALNKPFWFPNIPAFIIKLIFGEMSEIVLKGSRASSEKIRATGYVFKFPELKTALENLIS